MHSSQNAKTSASKNGFDAGQAEQDAILVKIAAFIQHLYLNRDTSRAMDGRHFVKFNDNDKQVAEHLKMSVADLVYGYGVLAKGLVLKRHGPQRIEIVNAGKLAETAKNITCSPRGPEPAYRTPAFTRGSAAHLNS